MTDSQHWPAYAIGPRESIVAMGVASIKFVELESVLRFLFGTIFGMSRDDTAMMTAKLGNLDITNLMQQKLPETGWDAATVDLVEHFIKAFNRCREARNHLMHSSLAWTGDTSTVLFKTTKKGETHAAVPAMEELRTVAARYPRLLQIRPRPR